MESSSTTISVMHKGQFVTTLDYSSGDSDNSDAQAQALKVSNAGSNSPPHAPHQSPKAGAGASHSPPHAGKAAPPTRSKPLHNMQPRNTGINPRNPVFAPSGAPQLVRRFVGGGDGAAPAVATAPSSTSAVGSSSRPVRLSESPKRAPPAKVAKALASRDSHAGKHHPVSTSRNPREWDVQQDIALCTEVVEGETYLMIKAKGAKVETLTLVKRSAGIPHGKTALYWQEIIEKLESGHHQRISKDKDVDESEPLFPHPLKVDYVKNRFEKLVASRAAKVEKLSKKKPSSSNSHDWVSGAGDNSEESEDEVGLGAEDKAHFESRDSLLDAYLAQVRVFAADCDKENEEPDPSSQRGGASKRKLPAPGLENEDQDCQLMEDAFNAGSKMKRLPKLPKITAADRAQSEATDHTSRVGAGFEALALSQKPDSVEVFSAKLSAGFQAASNAVAGAIQAWSDHKKASRACVSPLGHEFSPIEGVVPPLIICKHCAMRV